MKTSIRLAWACLALLIGLLFVGCKQSMTCQEIVEEYLSYEKRFIENNDTASLVASFNSMPAEGAKCLDACLTRGDILFEVNYDLAKRSFYAALKVDQKNVYGLFRLGLLFQEADKYDSSIHYFQKALDKKRHGDAIIDFPNNKGILATKEGKYDVQSTEIFFQLGISCYYNRNLKEAISYFDACIARNYMLGEAYKYRGAIYIEGNRPEKACEDFNQAKWFGRADVDEFINKYCKKKV